MLVAVNEPDWDDVHRAKLAFISTSSPCSLQYTALTGEDVMRWKEAQRKGLLL